jgi:HlyD family secretion protein
MTNRTKIIGLVAVLAVVAGLWIANVVTNGRLAQTRLTVQSNVEMTETNLNSQFSGKVKAVTVKEGDPVRKGQVLVTIESDTINAQLDQANARVAATKAQLNSATATRDYAQTSYNRIKGLFEKGLATQADFDDISNKLNQALAGLSAVQSQSAQAEAGLAETKTYLDKTTIAAPAGGIITMVNVEPGELVSTGMPLVVLTDLDHPWIQCSIRETDLSRVSLGQSVTVKLPAYQDRVFQGKVVRINKDADFAVKRATNANGEFDVVSFGIKVELQNPDKPLYAGMTAFVDFGG